METQAYALKPVGHLRLQVKDPFNFKYTFWKPSHFPTGLEMHMPEASWRTFRMGETLCGIRAEFVRGFVEVEVFADSTWSQWLLEPLSRRIVFSYGLSEDIRAFDNLAQCDSCLQPAAEALRGMRISCPESVFEITIIALLLQNVTIGRTRAMLACLMERYGRLVTFDGQSLYAFFAPRELMNVGEKELRENCRLGYRAGYLPSIVAFFQENGDDASLLECPRENIRGSLRKIRGVGPYTSEVVASKALRDPQAIAFDVWNRRLVARSLLKTDDASPDALWQCLHKRFPGWEGMACLYIVEYEYMFESQKTAPSRILSK